LPEPVNFSYARNVVYRDIGKAQFIEAIKLLKGLQTQMTKFQRQQGPAKARDAYRSTNGDDSHVSRIGALTWWNSHVRIVGHDVAYAMIWTDLKKKMAGKYCSRVEIKKLEAELWNLKVKDCEICGGLPDMIHRSVVASNPKTMQKAIEIATELMDKKIRTFAKCQT
ncbi:hypothetical protein Tco_1497514, partial [Tanacetum coccineum]